MSVSSPAPVPQVALENSVQPQAEQGCWSRCWRRVTLLEPIIYTLPEWGGGTGLAIYGYFVLSSTPITILGAVGAGVGVFGMKRIYTWILKAQLYDEELALKAATQNLINAGKDYARDSRSLSVVIDKMDQKTTQIESQMNVTATAVDKAAQELHHADGTLVQGIELSTTELTNAIQALRKQNTDLQSQLNSATETIRKMDQERIALSQNINALKTEIDVLTQKKKQLNDQLESLNKQIEVGGTDMKETSQFISRLNHLNGIIHSQQEAIKTLNEECANLKAAFSVASSQ